VSTSQEWNGRLLNGPKSEHGAQTAKAMVKFRNYAVYAMASLSLRVPPFKKSLKQRAPDVKGRAKQQRRRS
jgi:hypothetical protein